MSLILFSLASNHIIDNCEWRSLHAVGHLPGQSTALSLVLPFFVLLQNKISLGSCLISVPKVRELENCVIKGKQICKAIKRLNTNILSDTYKYLYMFRPLWPSSGWIQYHEKTINIAWYSTNVSVV